MPPLVSISVITYNQEQFVEQALRAALEQDYEPLEVVVADDGSKDATPEIIRSLHARYPGRLKPVLDPVNVGITRNSNRALEACRGEFIAFQGGDDVLLPGKIAAQVAWFAQDPRHALCGHNVEVFDETPGVMSSTASQLSEGVHGVGPGDFIREGCPFTATSVMVRASTIPSSGFDERLPMVSDWKLWVDCLMGGGIYGTLTPVLGRYRWHPGNVSRSASAKCWQDAFVGYALVEAEHPEFTLACRIGRANMFYREGVNALQNGDRRSAREFLTHAMQESAFHSAKLPLWWLFSALPDPVRKTMLAARSRLGDAARFRRGSVIPS